MELLAKKKTLVFFSRWENNLLFCDFGSTKKENSVYIDAGSQRLVDNRLLPVFFLDAKRILPLDIDVCIDDYLTLHTVFHKACPGRLLTTTERFY